MATATSKKGLSLEILTPEKKVFEGQVSSITAMGKDGAFGIMSTHQPLTCPLDIELLTIQDLSGVTKVYTVMGGLLSTDGKKITVLTDAAEFSDDIDQLRAEEAKKRAEARLKTAEADSVDLDRASLALKRAIARIKTKG